MKKHLSTVILILIFLAGVSLLLYPTVSDYWNSMHASAAVTSYAEQVSNLDEEKYDEMLSAAREYNRSLPGRENPYLLSPAQKEQYESLLNLDGTGIMGYIEIPNINVSLPIYHGTEEETLERGVGHLIGSSLPIGGSSTHAILTGHSGLASQKMFSDLDKLEVGDTFYLEVLNEVLAYEVDQINTVLPHDTTYLGLEEGKDLCTLVTCTPFGVNTHRLLVRGHRIPYTPENTDNPTIELAETEESVDSTWEQEYEKGVYLAIGIVALICLILFIVWLTQKGENNAA